jgi:hypothetical protein
VSADGTTGAIEGTTTTSSTTAEATIDASSDGALGSTGTTEDTHSSGGSGQAFECDLFAQDCPDGEKCIPYANDGGPALNATRCAPVVPDPAAAGEPCTVQGHATSGIDDCDATSMCWYLDENLQGECTAFYTGSGEDPQCADGHTCTLSASFVTSLCVPQCNPLAPDCGDAGCYPINDAFACAPVVADRSAGHGSPCEFINNCPAGTLCIGADAHSECAGAVGCCSIVCDVTSPQEDPCPELDPGLSCESWFVRGMAPEGYEDVGACALPL